MTFESGFNQSDKAALDLIDQLESQLDSDVSILKHVDTEYVLSSRWLSRLILDINTREKIIRIIDIEVERKGEGVGSEVVQSLAEVAVENDYTLLAENVSHSLDPWWRDRGFSPSSPHSADYVFRDNKSGT